MNNAKNKPFSIVIGLGASGNGVAKLLLSQGCEVVLFEQNKNANFLKRAQELIALGIQVKLGTPLEIESFEPWLDKLNLIVISPGIPLDHPTLQKLKTLGIPIKGEVEIAWQSLKNIPWIGITGTNGKTTVTRMLNHVLQSTPLKAPMGGNIGTSVSEIAHNINYKKNLEPPDWLVVELSSYQLESSQSISPKIGIWTTFTPDHLERHKSLETYFLIKKKLLDNAELRIYNGDDNYLFKSRRILSPGIWTSTNSLSYREHNIDFWINERGYICEQNTELFSATVLKLPGNHNLQNLLLVVAASRRIGLTPLVIKNALKSFNSIPHRIEDLGQIHGAQIYNDSKATNFDSSEIGLQAIEKPIVLIAGGKLKEGDPKKWIEEINKSTSVVVLFGECAKELSTKIKQSKYKGTIYCRRSLEQAVEISIKALASTNSKSLLFSPACASFDQYNNFEERGNHFKDIIWSLHNK